MLNGKLWNYNLNYFACLNQRVCTKSDGIYLINSFIGQVDRVKDGLEPYPVSIRSINWIKFLTRNNVNNTNINRSLYAQYRLLMHNLEYHLLGNHLLENGFSLLFGAYYFREEKFYRKAKRILQEELAEQVLPDGAHFERSPMYAQLVLFRLLDCINLVNNNNWENYELPGFLSSKARSMLRWINYITYENGNIPLVNDSAYGIAPATKELNEYAEELGVIDKKHDKTWLHEDITGISVMHSGYAKIVKKAYELFVDVGNIGPDYIPGHAHSDTFSFELYINNNPYIVDTGTSTYENNRRRLEERKTSAHNTVEVETLDQSEVWSSFRVARRAKVHNVVYTDGHIAAEHDGYVTRIGCTHIREFAYTEKEIIIQDELTGKKKYNAVSRLHFYPGLIPVVSDDGTIKVNAATVKVNHHDTINIKPYLYAPEFNKTIEAYMVEILFTGNRLETKIIV